MSRFFLIYILFLLTLTGCSEIYDVNMELYPTLKPRYISVSPTSLTFVSTSDSKNILVTSTETPWVIDNDIDWISASPERGGSSALISVNAKENTSGDDSRIGIIYLKADVSDWKFEAPISITQAGATPFIELSRSEIELAGSEFTETISVKSNCTWSVNSTSEWITATKKDDSIIISGTINETNSYRTATLVVFKDINEVARISEKITVRQAPASINASTESLVFNNSASSVSITINSEANWYISTSNSWIEVSPDEGTPGTSTIIVSVSPNTSTNERTGYIALSIGDCQRIQIPVRQKGIYIESEQTQLSFTANGGIQELSILSNTSWEFSSIPSWITVSTKNGQGDGKVKITALDNPNTASRSDVIHITQKGLDIDLSINVIQSGKTFDINTTVLNFEDKEETQSVNISTDGTWSAKANESWISISPSSATGSSTLSIKVSENPEDSERTGSVTVTMGDKSETIKVIQTGKYFTVSNNLLTYTSKGGSINISITTNDTWTAKIENNPSWLKLSNTNGSGHVDVKVTASDNPSVNSRKATIIFETIHNQSIKVIVSQDARYLNVDTREVLFYSKGGTSESIKVSTDGKFIISCSDSWFNVNQTNNIFTVSASENPTKDIRIGHITIALTDLQEGSYSLKLTVTQLYNGGSFILNDFKDDTNYDNKSNTSGNITINWFGNDVNYDSTAKIWSKLTISNYKSDTSWDTGVSSGVSITTIGYNSANNFDTSIYSSESITKKEYGEETNMR